MVDKDDGRRANRMGVQGARMGVQGARMGVQGARMTGNWHQIGQGFVSKVPGGHKGRASRAGAGFELGI